MSEGNGQRQPSGRGEAGEDVGNPSKLFWQFVMTNIMWLSLVAVVFAPLVGFCAHLAKNLLHWGWGIP
jgi:hypothetical protein